MANAKPITIPSSNNVNADLGEAADFAEFVDAPGRSVAHTPVSKAVFPDALGKPRLEESDNEAVFASEREEDSGVEGERNADIVLSEPFKGEGTDEALVSAPGIGQKEMRKHTDESPDDAKWVQRKKHIFILSNAGKPIYSRYGDEQKLSTLMALMQAMVSFLDDQDDQLRCIVAGKHKFVFAVRGPLILVCVACTAEPLCQLEQQLDYLHGQIVSLLTMSFDRIFKTRENYDLRTLLGGADMFLDNLITEMDQSLAFFLKAVSCLRLDATVREVVNGALQAGKSPDLIFAVLLSGNQLVSMLRPKKRVLHPSDVHLMINFINSSTSFRDMESWTPLCLPKFNSRGFVHVLVAYIDQERCPDLCLLLMTPKPDQFHQMRESKSRIAEALASSGALPAIGDAAKKHMYRCSGVAEVGVHGTMHFAYKSLSSLQFTAPAPAGPYAVYAERKRLLRVYQHVRACMHHPSLAHPHRVYYHVSDAETVLAWVTQGFELFATFGPLITKTGAITACNRLLRWVKREENTLFIRTSPVL